MGCFYQNGRFYSACDDHTIQAHMLDDGTPDGLLTRFTAPVSCLCFNSAGTHMAAGAWYALSNA